MENRQKPNPYSKPKARDQKSYLKYSGIAFEVVAFNLLVVWGGHALDNAMANEIPWMVILAVLVAVAGTIFYLLKRLGE